MNLILAYTAVKQNDNVAVSVTRSDFDVEGYELTEFGVLYSRAGKTSSIEDANETLLYTTVGDGSKKAFEVRSGAPRDNTTYKNTLAFSANKNTVYSRGYAVLKNTETGELVYVYSDVKETVYS